MLQKAVCTAPAQKNSKQDIDPLIHLVAGAVLLPVGIFLQSTHDDVLLLMGNTSFLFGLVQLILQMCHLAQAGFVFIAALEAGNNRPDIKGGDAYFLLLERGQAAEHFVVVFIHRVAVCDFFLEAFVKSFVLFLGLIRRQIQAGLLPGDISGIAQDRGLSLRLGHGFELL